MCGTLHQRSFLSFSPLFLAHACDIRAADCCCTARARLGCGSSVCPSHLTWHPQRTSLPTWRLSSSTPPSPSSTSPWASSGSGRCASCPCSSSVRVRPAHTVQHECWAIDRSVAVMWPLIYAFRVPHETLTADQSLHLALSVPIISYRRPAWAVSGESPCRSFYMIVNSAHAKV